MPSLSRPTSSFSRTLQRIYTGQLRPVMFLVRVLDSWCKFPFFVHRRVLTSPTDVQQFVRSGIREVEIDTSRGGGLQMIEQHIDDSFSEATENPIVSCDQKDSDMAHSPSVSTDAGSSLASGHETGSGESQNREEVVQLREAVMAAVEGAFGGMKTGHPISQPAVYAAAQALVQKILVDSALVAEILLFASLKPFHKILYAHVVDTAAYSILNWLQLGWNEGK